MEAREREILAALAEGRVPAEDPAEGEVCPELRALVQHLREVQQLALHLGRGELTLPDTARSRGPLMGSLKALLAALRHLSWQAQRVAEGDLSHQVDFMGEFADAFNEMVRQLAERSELETQLRQSQKLEAIGRLAGGLAHEINTPAQYVGSDIQFLSESCDTLLTLLAQYREALAKGGEAPLPTEVLERLRAAEEDAEIEFLEEELSASAKSATQGIQRIAEIVRAMKGFANPDVSSKTNSDLNCALRDTLTVAHSEYKDVAAIEAEFGELPFVSCRLGEVREVFLNLISNAVHAIEDSDRCGKGVIRIHTRAEGEGARIDVTDNGCGIPPEIAEAVFDPFFTTKTVGRGSGQGLAVARSVIVDGHEGSLTFESHPGEGTTFSIWLPTE